MSLRNIFYKLAHDVSRYPNIVQLTNTLDHGFKEIAEHIQDGGSEVEVTPVYTSGEKLATITVNDVDNEIYMPNGEVKTMEGSSFKTVNGSLVDEMKVGFTPIQDLHGYSKPWPGGAGKNKLPISADSLKSINTGGGVWSDDTYTLSGVSFELMTDSDGNVESIKINGNPSSNVDFKIGGAYGTTTPFTGADNYTSSMPTSSSVVMLAGYGSTVLLNNSTMLTENCPDGLAWCLIRVPANSTNNDVIIQPMIRLSSIADPTFEPYSNICPISGHTDVQSKINNNTYTTTLGDTYYGGDVDQVSGTGKSEWTNITSYAGESITEPWLSSLDEYIPNTTPSTGAQVCYKIATPTSLTLTGQNITAEPGVNEVNAPGANQEILEVKYHQMMTIQDVEKLIQ